MLLHLVERIALALTLGPPRGELVVELRPILLPILVIIAVERRDLAGAPAVIIAVAIAIAFVALVVIALVVAVVGLAAALGVLVAEPAADLVARARQETALVIIIALRLATIVASALLPAAGL
jgi:hypothetical protein